RRAGRSGGDAEQKAVIAALRALAREAAEGTGHRSQGTAKEDQGPWPGSEIASVMFPIDPSEDVGWESRLPAFRRKELEEEAKLQKAIAAGVERWMKRQAAAARGPKRRIARGGRR
ncbi:MAG: hypothetical protein ACSLFM_13925, partial [Tepidiformaceae bacterium]